MAGRVRAENPFIPMGSEMDVALGWSVSKSFAEQINNEREL